MGIYSIDKRFKKDFPRNNSYNYLKRKGQVINPKRWQLWNGDFPYIDSFRWDDRPLIILGETKDDDKKAYYVLKITHTGFGRERDTVDKRFKYKCELKDADKEGLETINKKTGEPMKSFTDCNYCAILRPERFRNFRNNSLTERDSSAVFRKYMAAVKNNELNIIRFNKGLDKLEEETDKRYRDMIRNIKFV